jgi:hypothetical protein
MKQPVTKKFFKKILKKYKVESPAELSDSDKKKFFEEIDAGWTSNLEEAKPSIKDTYEKLSKMSLQGYGRRINYPELLDFKRMDNDEIVSELLAFMYDELEIDRFYKILR